jgi:hypothetical protein
MSVRLGQHRKKYLFRAVYGRTFLMPGSICAPVKFFGWFTATISASVEIVLRGILCWLSLIWLVLACTPKGTAAEVEAKPITSGRFVGVAGCKSSSCHGGAGEKRNQYLTWSQKDFHTRAYAILTNARSARIAETL